MSTDKRIEWFDLSRFGVALRVVPESPLRGQALTCLEIRDQDRYEAVLGLEKGVSTERRREIREAFADALAALDFDASPTYVVGDAGTPVARLFSRRQKLSFGDIRRLVPSVEITDLRQMAVSDIAIRPTPSPEAAIVWREFLDKTLSQDAVGVWVRKQNPLDLPWSESGKIQDLKPKPGQVNRLLDRIAGGFVEDKLQKAGYRQNALIGYYVDLASAEADGVTPVELEQVDLPYAAPLWVTRNHQVMALRDVRFAPEIMAMHPVTIYGEPTGGLVAEPLRAGLALRPMMEKHVAQWEAWAQAPESVTWPDMIWASISEVVSAAGELGWKHSKLGPVDNRLTDGLHEERNGQYRAIPIAEMSAQNVLSLAQTVNQFVNFEGAARDGIERSLQAVVDRANALHAEAAKEVARSQLQTLAQTVRGSEPDRSDQVRHEDVGEKIGGARKDFAKRAMVIDDLDTMNAAEREALVRKGNVWPALDYKAMRERGVTPQAAMAIKIFKDALAMAPSRLGRRAGWREGDDPAEVIYIKAIAMARDAMASVQNLDEFGKAVKALYISGKDDPTDNVIYGARIQAQWGRKASSMLFDAEDGRIPRAMAYAIRTKVGDTDERFGHWDKLIAKGKEVSEEERAERKTKGQLEEELHRPHLDKVQREGTDWRQGRDVVGQDFIDHFGFRAVEFGNWLPQDERQQVLNFAWDGLLDLAQALDLPPKGLSLDGRLAVAFGSRGQGGKRAALAHFEPERFVINLTRMKGAGSLAHEWWHAFDMHLNGSIAFASEVATSGPMSKLSSSMQKRPTTLDELERGTTKNVDKMPGNIASWMRTSTAGEEFFLPTIHHEIAKLREDLYGRAEHAIATHKDNPRFNELGFSHMGPVPTYELLERAGDILEKLKALHPEPKAFTKYKKNIEGNLNFLVRNMAVNCTAAALKAAGVEPPKAFVTGSNAVKTKFFTDAEALDKSRSEPYWGTTRELLARAGAAYVYDRLAALDVRSDYLVYGSDEGRYANHPLGNPNPEAEDRAMLAPYFADVIEDYRLRCVQEKEPETADLEM